MRSARRQARITVAASLAVLLLAGCSSTGSSDDGLVSNRPRPAPAEKYPDFSKPLESAMTQMSDEQAAQQEAQLSSLTHQRRTGAISAAEYNRRVEELRLLGQQTK